MFAQASHLHVLYSMSELTLFVLVPRIIIIFQFASPVRSTSVTQNFETPIVI